MKMKKRTIAAVLFLAVITVSGYGLYRQFRGKEIAMPSLFKPAGSRLLMSMEKFSFIQSERGRVSWRLDTQHADLYENKEAKMVGVEVVYNNPGNGTVALIGASGTMDTTTGNASIRGNSEPVKVVTSDGYLLTTSSLTWKSGEKTVRTAEPFKMLGREIYLEGRGLTARVENHTMTVDNNVKAILQE
jgi:LPS export ABC transporter protein LptC